MQTRFDLTQKDIPKNWYNLLADFPEPLPPPLHPGTKEPMPPEALEAIFPRNLIEQETSTERWIEIPEPVREVYALWRPTPLLRAVRLEKALQTPAHIYYKYEGASPAGSHKVNTSVPQAYFNRLAGTRRLATETGAGQWGASLAMACKLFGLECNVYMVKVSYDHKPYRRMLMHVWGATVHASPSNQTEYGRKLLAEDPHCPGSLGIAISEAIEDTTRNPNTKYSLGSVLNHVCLHQTVIGQESIRQMELAGEEPDSIIGCCGGGSNFAGLAFPFMQRKLAGGKNYRIVGVEPSACPTLTKGELRYDFGDTAETTPLLKMFTLGHEFMPPSIHSGGLRYHGMSPMVSHALKLGLMEAEAYQQTKVFEAATLFAQNEGVVPAPESAHAIAAVIAEAVRARESGQKRVILFNLSGHGLLDLSAYEAYLHGKLQDV
ncbi:MAG TPA: TrpB-like pyridoxal phosphate-dependent enzyme [Verrucomicrobia bacterium]|nr:TrpB-like pyridoxal phosphate-dependent enzyme [Verrucomicrobiota bacterium]HOB31967.1 TrpB-like pyridoxal phosphate-dependent enzyme [Verrucomicrobiota bacterium]HOP96892.1 TrpB-like pyridoxal phosphate-dependent enzyme [Verrucomicrobiota bacterium]